MNEYDELLNLCDKKLHELEIEIRSEVARDLHDGVVGPLQLALFEAEQLTRNLRMTNSFLAMESLRLQDAIIGVISVIRQVMTKTSPIPRGPDGLMTVLHDLVKDIERHQGIVCKLVYSSPLLVINKEDAIQIYRIVQEAITNAIKHGKADEILLTFNINPDNSIDLYVVDNGIGLQDHLPVKGSGVGMHSMRNRAQKLGGDIELSEGQREGMIMHLHTGPLELDKM